MKETFEKIDRGTLLKGTGAAALLSLLAGAKAGAKSGAHPKPTPPTQCCEPGNDGLSYANSRSNLTLKGAGPFKTVHGIWLMKSGPGGAAPKAPAGYKPAYYIPGATGRGHDSNGSPNTTSNKDLYVFVKM